ncbi:MAG: methyl-accepting chemotaxis protein, partial [Archaeoglobaceae archaeon]|nr:methyl-accepting chemotaxis protein [Archaeoglobaceae archaeon]
MSSEVFLSSEGKSEVELLRIRLAEREREIERLREEIQNKTKEVEKARELQKMFEAIFKTIPKPFYLFFVGRDGRLRYINNAASEIFQRKVEDMIGRRPSELFYGDKDRTRTLAEVGGKTLIEKAIERGGLAYEAQETTYILPKGEIKVVASGAPVMVDGEFVGMIGFFVDVTNLKEQEAAARKALEAAKAKEEEIRELYSYTSKCLNELSRGIRELSRGNLNIQLAKFRDDEFGKTFEEFNRFVQTLNQEISNLLSSMKGTVKML